jgi:hypothetical protein
VSPADALRIGDAFTFLLLLSGAASTPRPAATPAVALSHPPAAKPTIVTYRVRSGAEVDLGWTGISHDQAWPTEQRVSMALDCPKDSATCAVGGGVRGDLFGSPIALSAGGVSVCVVNRLREPLTGTVDAQRGCGSLEMKLTAAVWMGETLARPCPVCAGDRTANDARKQGHCERGPARGKPCDAQGMSAIFGATANDCAPPGTSVGELAIDLAPLTTGAVRRDADVDCRRTGQKARCFCAAQSQSNACDSGTCGAAESCEGGPVDGVCSKAPFRSCTGASNEDCTANGLAGGVCEQHPRRCFGPTIAANGTCDPKTPTYVAVFCAPATRAPALNATAGLPGPARLVLPLERLANGDTSSR